MKLPHRLASVGAALGLVLLGSAGLAHAQGSARSPKAVTFPQCSTSDLAVRKHIAGGAAGSLYVHIIMRNTTSHTCWTRGYSGVSYVGFGTGTQIGAAARRVHPRRVHTVRLDPGERAVATLQEVDARNYPRHKCRPAHTDGLRVYPPDQTAAAFVPQKTIGCKNHRVHLLSISPYHHHR
jgi:hypothetical protein